MSSKQPAQAKVVNVFTSADTRGKQPAQAKVQAPLQAQEVKMTIAPLAGGRLTVCTSGSPVILLILVM